MKSFTKILALLLTCSATGFFGVQTIIRLTAKHVNTTQFSLPDTPAIEKVGTLKTARRKNHAAPSQNIRVALSIAEDGYTATDDTKKIARALNSIVTNEEPSLLSRGVRRIVLRPVQAERSYVEILGYSREGKLLGSFLLRESFANNTNSLRQVLGQMWFARETKDEMSGRLVVDSQSYGDPRAYINGYPLMHANQQNTVGSVFKLRNAFQDNDTLTLTVTADGAPLVSSVLDKSEFHRTHRWMIPVAAELTSHLAVK